jgi:hypothetical protein
MEQSENESLSEDSRSDVEEENQSNFSKSEKDSGAFKIKDQVNVLVKDLKDPSKISKLLTGHHNQTLGDHMKQQDSKVVQYGKDQHGQWADVYSPRGNRRLRINFKNHQKVNKIQSSLVKRLELEHIEDIIEGLSIVPDFGFPLLIYEQEFRGWELLRDHIQNGSKFERVNNFIEAKKYEIEMENKRKFLELSQEKKMAIM